MEKYSCKQSSKEKTMYPSEGTSEKEMQETSCWGNWGVPQL
jgi:hypothetical protein